MTSNKAKLKEKGLTQLNLKIKISSKNALSLIKAHSGKSFRDIIEEWITDEYFKLHRKGAFEDLIPAP